MSCENSTAVQNDRRVTMPGGGFPALIRRPAAAFAILALAIALDGCSRPDEFWIIYKDIQDGKDVPVSRIQRSLGPPVESKAVDNNREMRIYSGDELYLSVTIETSSRKVIGASVARPYAPVTELEKQRSVLRADTGRATVDLQAGGTFVLSPTIDMPAQVLPPRRSSLPWNYDTGLYVFPER